MKYIFVEGFDDNNLISEFVKDKEDIQIIQYAERKNEKVDGMMATFNSMNIEYIFLADLDEKSEEIRKKKICKQFKKINCEKIFFSIQEIEAWYMAILSDNHINKYKIKSKLLKDTQNITKEKFENIFKERKETILEVKFDILSELNLEKAKSRNNSLKLFLENAIGLC